MAAMSLDSAIRSGGHLVLVGDPKQLPRHLQKGSRPRVVPLHLRPSTPGIRGAPVSRDAALPVLPHAPPSAGLAQLGLLQQHNAIRTS
eukprot:891191-Pyramimonas_sp.AAC.1